MIKKFTLIAFVGSILILMASCHKDEVESENFVTLFKTEVEVPSNGGIFNISVESIGDVTYQISSDAPWITGDDTKAGDGSRSTISKFSFTAEAGDTEKSRQGMIFFTCSTDTDTLIVTQGASGGLSLSTEKLSFYANGGNAEVEINANFEYITEIPSDASWITVSETKADWTTTPLTITVERNEGESSRSAQITFKSAEGGISTKLTVEQAGLDPGYASFMNEETIGYYTYSGTPSEFCYEKFVSQYGIVEKESSYEFRVVKGDDYLFTSFPNSDLSLNAATSLSLTNNFMGNDVESSALEVFVEKMEGDLIWFYSYKTNEGIIAKIK